MKKSITNTKSINIIAYTLLAIITAFITFYVIFSNVVDSPSTSFGDSFTVRLVQAFGGDGGDGGGGGSDGGGGGDAAPSGTTDTSTGSGGGAGDAAPADTTTDTSGGTTDGVGDATDDGCCADTIGTDTSGSVGTTDGVGDVTDDGCCTSDTTGGAGTTDGVGDAVDDGCCTTEGDMAGPADGVGDVIDDACCTSDGGTPDPVSPIVPDVPSNPTTPVTLTCALTVNLHTITRGQSIVLSWSISNGQMVNINQGIGLVSGNGTRILSPLVDTTYTLTTVNDAGATVTCTDTVIVTTSQINTPLSCDSFTVTPNSMSSAGTALLSWNTTGATSVSINNNIGAVTADGSTTTVVSGDTTYTLTATGGATSVTCQTAVDITTGGGGGGGGGGGSSSPRCELTVSDKNITAGDTVKLTWKNLRTNDILIKDDHGKTIVNSKKTSSIDEDSGSVVVSPTETTKYTLTAIKGSKERECVVTVSVMSLTSYRSQDTLLLAGLPYTGFEAGETLTFIFYALIVIWGMIVGYVLVFKKKRLHDSHEAHVNETHTHTETVTQTTTDTHDFVPANLSTHHEETSMETKVVSSSDDVSFLEEHAHEQYALISSDALRLIKGQSDVLEEQLGTLNRVIALAKIKYPKENDWIVINKERLMEILA